MEGIIEATERVMDFLNDVPLSAIMLKNYQRYYQTIIAFCESSGIGKFGDIEAETFTKNQESLYKGGDFGINLFRHLRKAAVLLADQEQGRELLWRRREYQEKMSGSFENALSMFSLHLGKTVSAITCKGMVSMARQFLIFLEGNGTRDIVALTADDVKQFMAYRAKKHPKSMRHTLARLRSFCSFLNSMGLAEINADRYLVRPAPRHVKLLPCFTDNEAAAILSAVDRTTTLGKRDFAILKIALGTGLRGVDILGLKRSDIDWKKSEINVLQSKTNTYMQLPLLPDVGNAIAEYILDARPESESSYIFLRTRMPHKQLSAAGHDIISRYMEKAEVAHEVGDGKSFHALRRTVGTRLVKAKIPLPTVAQMLIHRDIDSTKRYVSLDDETLRVCCLDISEYATDKGGLS